MLFPYDTPRPEQSKLIDDVKSAVENGQSLIAHAPTGLGKTAAVLSPALQYALTSNKTIFFLTSRHTQHHIAIETLQQIKKKHNINFSVIDILGKKHMCARDDVQALFTRQFHEYCQALRDKEECLYFKNFKRNGQPTNDAKKVMQIIGSTPHHSEQAVTIAKNLNVCPYEASALASEKATVIVADYYYIFNPRIRESFLKRNSKTLADAIIVVDEAHNLPGRMREMLTEKITSVVVDRAIKEADKWYEDAIKDFLLAIQNALDQLAAEAEERVVEKEQFLDLLDDYDIDTILTKMDGLADTIRESSKQSFIGSIADFVKAWQSQDEGYARILNTHPSSQGPIITLSYQCLDPSIETAPLLKTAHSTILMSGTLTPTDMYNDLLGFPPGTIEKEYDNPMPKENKLALIVSNVTTKFSKRTPDQFIKIADTCNKALDAIQGNTAIYFPSYKLLNEIHIHLHKNLQRPIFKEQPNLSKEEKQTMLKNFKQSHAEGAVLLAVLGGSFSEGIDLPGAYLNAVIIVGLPLGKPDLHTKALINYYQDRYQRGWEYGYIFPAFTKALQSAGRCIRSETDRGVILFLDERYAWDRYYQCFPADITPKITSFYQEAIRDFFKRK